MLHQRSAAERPAAPASGPHAPAPADPRAPPRDTPARRHRPRPADHNAPSTRRGGAAAPALGSHVAVRELVVRERTRRAARCVPPQLAAITAAPWQRWQRRASSGRSDSRCCRGRSRERSCVQGRRVAGRAYRCAEGHTAAVEQREEVNVISDLLLAGIVPHASLVELLSRKLTTVAVTDTRCGDAVGF